MLMLPTSTSFGSSSSSGSCQYVGTIMDLPSIGLSSTGLMAEESEAHSFVAMDVIFALVHIVKLWGE